MAEVHATAGVTTWPVDEMGSFAVEPIPTSPSRLRFRATDRIDLRTGWITL